MFLSSLRPLQSLDFVPDLDEETRKAALKRTAEVLRELDQIRRVRELPPESLREVVDVYLWSAREVVSEKRRAELEQERAAAAERCCRLPMEMKSIDREHQPLRVRPGMIVPVLVRPQWLAYQVEEIEIAGDPARWRVHGISVGNRSQFPGGTAPIPGEQFKKGGIMSGLRLETCQTAMDFALKVEYVGPDPQGEIFEATLLGASFGNVG